MDQHINSFLKESVVGVLSTCRDNEIYSVPVYYFHDEADNAFYFITKSKSSKISNLKKTNKASFCIFSETLPRVFNAKCSIEIFNVNGAGFDGIEIVRKLAEVHSTQDYYPSPISMIKDGELNLVKLNVLTYDYKAYISQD